MMKTISLPVSSNEDSKIKTLFELARQGFNHLAALDLHGRETDYHLRKILMAFYKDESSMRLLGAELAMSLRKRDWVKGEANPFKRLGEDLGVIHLAPEHVLIRGNEVNVRNVLHFVITENLGIMTKASRLEISIHSDMADVRLQIEARDGQGHKLRKYPSGMRKQSMSAMHKTRRERS